MLLGNRNIHLILQRSGVRGFWMLIAGKTSVVYFRSGVRRVIRVITFRTCVSLEWSVLARGTATEALVF